MQSKRWKQQFLNATIKKKPKFTKVCPFCDSESHISTVKSKRETFRYRLNHRKDLGLPAWRHRHPKSTARQLSVLREQRKLRMQASVPKSQTLPYSPAYSQGSQPLKLYLSQTKAGPITLISQQSFNTYRIHTDIWAHPTSYQKCFYMKYRIDDCERKGCCTEKIVLLSVKWFSKASVHLYWRFHVALFHSHA